MRMTLTVILLLAAVASGTWAYRLREGPGAAITVGDQQRTATEGQWLETMAGLCQQTDDPALHARYQQVKHARDLRIRRQRLLAGMAAAGGLAGLGLLILMVRADVKVQVAGVTNTQCRPE